MIEEDKLLQKKRHERFASLMQEAKEFSDEHILRETIRLAYYIIFHDLCIFILIHATKHTSLNLVAQQKLYRSIEHKELKNKLGSKEIKENLGYSNQFSVYFAELQQARNIADYDPSEFKLKWQDIDELYSKNKGEISQLRKLSLETKNSIAFHFIFKNKERP